MREFLFSPVMPWIWLILLAVLIGVGAAVTFFYGLRSKWRIALLWTFRALALGLFVLVLGQPQQRREEVTVLKPQLAVLVDTSESMTDPADETQPRRSEQAAKWLASPAFTNQLANFDVRVFAFDQSLSEAGDVKKLAFKGDRSNVLGALRQAQDRFRGQPLAAICLLSDGLETINPAKAGDIASPTTVPVFTFELEKAFKPKPKTKEAGIIHADYPGRVVSGWEVEIKISVRALAMAGQTVIVELWRDGRKQQETTVAFGEDEQTRDAVFMVTHDRAGVAQYEARLADPSAKKDSGKAPFVIDVVEPGNRVLYIQNTLSFDFKFLRKAIEANRNLQLAAYVRWKDGKLVSLSSAGRAMEGASLDFSAASLARYSVVIIGNLPVDSLSADDYKGLRDYVEKGGGLVVLGGGNSLLTPAINATALKSVLPVTIGSGAEYREGAFPVAITDTGLHHPVFGSLFAKIHEFQPLQTLNLTDADPLAQVLVRANWLGRQVPLVTAKQVVKGRVLTVATDTIFGWRLAEKGWSGQMSPYDTFWAQLMDWLIPKEQEKGTGEKLEVFTDRPSYLVGEKPEVRAIVTLPGGAKGPTQLALRVMTPDEKSFEYTMQSATLQTAGGRQVPGYRVAVEPHVAGVYVAEVTAPVSGTNVTAQARFVVAKPPTELTGQPINRELLQRLAETSKGKFLALGEWDNWRKSLHVEEQHFSRVQLLDLWNHPLLLGLLLAVLAMDWIARKLWSLP
jgi:uncharacterized membrane protein